MKMRKIDWIIVTLFVVAGLLCLTLSAHWLTTSEHPHVTILFFQICLITFIPILLAVVTYLVFGIKKRLSKNVKLNQMLIKDKTDS